MAKYRKVDPHIWNDLKFNSLSTHGKLAFIFLLTHPHMTPVGAMRATIPGLVAELSGVSEKALREPFEKGMAKVDEKACFIWLPKFLRYNPPENKNVAIAWGKSLQDIPECVYKNELIEHVKEFLKGYGKGFREAFEKTCGKSIPIQEQEQEQEQEQDKTLTCSPGDVVESYHKNLPELPKVKIISDTRKSQILARQREKHVNAAGISSQERSYWDGFFEYTSKSDFLMGRAKPNGSRDRPFRADLEWLTKKENFIKVIEAKYH